ncbi:MAG: hypothetical protein OEV18_04270 [Deltaproteobacteria bacterium]|nr:hypothetical protein [Deltaproteobacteria bacterium]MDH3927765.1 hypothetical protein [Deltaproteobacteria bacterium]PNV85799.1 MAG: hypothetical protein C0610_09950 [Desulfobacteraceae bacterium]
MPTWPYRFQLSLQDRLRRSVYEVLRDQMDMYLIQYALIDSYWNFCEAGEPYPFVPKRELKPRARVVEREHIYHNHFLVMFCEGTIPGWYKKYIRFFDSNKVTKEGVAELAYIQLHKKYTKNLRYFENPGFENLVLDLLPVDYALLIQKDPTMRTRTRYAMTHFHVKIDWPIDNATEEMAQQLRYIAKDLYEIDEKYAESLNNKLFENYGFNYAVGGRRTAAVVAAQFLKKMEFVSTVYVASTESRTLTRLSERGVSRYVLVKLPTDEISRLASENRMKFDNFVERFLIDVQDDFGVGVFQVVYRNTIHSKPPEDGKLRDLRPDFQWLTVSDQLLVPLPGHNDTYPVPYSTIYTPDFGDAELV